MKTKMIGPGILIFFWSAAVGMQVYSYEAHIEIRNPSREVKRDWPVILSVYQLFGRNLPKDAISSEGFHVYDHLGREVGWTLEQVPPYDTVGNNELIFEVSELQPDETLSYRITNQLDSIGRLCEIDLVNHPMNLLRNGGFEAPGKPCAEWSGQGARDTQVKRTGSASLRLRGTNERRVSFDATIPLRKGGEYYFGGWGKTRNVSRHALYDSKGGHFSLPGFYNGYTGDLMPASDTLSKQSAERLARRLAEKKQAIVAPQCATRDWAKIRFWPEGYTDGGLEKSTATATAATTTLEIILDQREQFFMAPDQTEGTWWLDDLVLLEQPLIRVDFERALKPLLRDGIFLFSRPTNTPIGNSLSRWSSFCTSPFPHEQVKDLSRFAVRGQRIPFLLGFYHQRPVSKLQVELQDGVLRSRNGATVPLEGVEWMPGLLSQESSKMLRKHSAPLNLPSKEGLPYFLVSFLVPEDVLPGSYEGSLEVFENGRLFHTIPVSLAIQDLNLPEIRDTFLGWIFQGDKNPPFNEEGLYQYSRSGFTSVTPFFKFFQYKDDVEPGNGIIDLEALAQRMDTLVRFGITAGVCPFSEFDLGSRWGGGALYKRVKGDKKSWQAEVRRLEEEVAKHPEWPRIIYMTWDEPIVGEKWVRGKHGGPDERMAWLPEVSPDALTNVDAHFKVFPHILKYYNMPNFDDPPDFVGPEIYKYLQSMGKDYGFAGAKPGWEISRYQLGLMMIASGARYFHQWHLRFPNKFLEYKDGEVMRSLDLVAAGEGVDDFKIYRLLRQEMDRAEAAVDQRTAAILGDARDYMNRILSTWNADHSQEQGIPYLGLAYSWGYDQFYDDWRKQMAMYAVALKGVKWIE